MNSSIILEYLSRKFNLTINNPKKIYNVTQYDLLYKGWCLIGRCIESATEFTLIIGYFVCFVDNLFGVIRLKDSSDESISDSTVWSWIVGAIQEQRKYDR